MGLEDALDRFDLRLTSLGHQQVATSLTWCVLALVASSIG
jgi:hypothetical protein